jgi:peptidoglycan/LPS O-acetylase OafA/YrhL
MLVLLRSSSPAFVGLSFVYLANVTDFFGVACDYGPLWSLAVEEHFYILWPTVVHRLTKRRLAWIAAFIAIVIPLLRGISFALGRKTGLDWYTWFAADGLAAGSLLAIFLRSSVSRRGVWTVSLSLLGASVLSGTLAWHFGILNRNHLLGASCQWTTIHLFFCGILLLFLLIGTSSLKRIVNVTILRFFGYISYGLYLDHLLAFRMYDRICRTYFNQLVPTDGHFDLVVLRFVLSGGSAVGVAYLSRKYFEGPFLRMKESLVTMLAKPGKKTFAPSGEVDTRVA